MNLFRKSRLAIVSITMMLVVAGYINYEYNPEREKNLGQTIYVNGKDSSEVDVVSIYEEQSSNVSEDTTSYEYAVNKENTIAVFKYDRDNMFSELSENYRQIIANTNTSVDKINEYQIKLNELLCKKNLITMVENIIKSKQIDDVVIIPTNNDNLNVIIKSKIEITKEQIAQVQQTLVDQFGINASKITITASKD
ncbi:MAG: SpoIIIAH-like family protein [Clostridia bacterium]|nr:SpoIIIAH-like family protein [Clostridia bacterium]MDD4386953.1 SpoIIIAH-like family protein [Clostridia bacterium]